MKRIQINIYENKKAVKKEYQSEIRCKTEYLFLNYINKKGGINCPMIYNNFQRRVNYIEYLEHQSLNDTIERHFKLFNSLQELKKIHSLKLTKKIEQKFLQLHNASSVKNFFINDCKQKVNLIRENKNVLNHMNFDIEEMANSLVDFVRKNVFQKCIIHGDFSYRNILVGNNKQVYLIDFEHAAILSKEFDFSKLYDNEYSEMDFNSFHRLLNKMYLVNKQKLKISIMWGRIGLIYYLLKRGRMEELSGYVQLFKKNKITVNG